MARFCSAWVASSSAERQRIAAEAQRASAQADELATQAEQNRAMAEEARQRALADQDRQRAMAQQRYYYGDRYPYAPPSQPYGGYARPYDYPR
jgi:hypothetical protein